MKAVSRIPSLDGIRAISIGLVLYCHYSTDIGYGDPLDLGALGVRIFFVISGFLITGLLLEELKREGSIKLGRFYFRRTLRIFPAFYFYVFCMLLLGSFGLADLSLRDSWPALTYTSNYALSVKTAVHHSWSLATEEQFYLIWPATLAIARRKQLAVWTLLALMAIAAVSSRLLSHQIGYHIPAFFNTPIGIGCLLALLKDRMDQVTLYRRWLRSSFGVVLPVIVVIANLPGLHATSRGDAILSMIESGAIALWIDWSIGNPVNWVGRVLNSRLARTVGIGSYSLYLWQQPFLCLNGDSDGSAGGPVLLLSGHWWLLSYLPCRVALVVLSAGFSYFIVERPLMRFRSVVEPFLFRKRSATVVPSDAVAGGAYVETIRRIREL